MATSIVKGMPFDSTVAPLVPHMSVVNDHRDALQRLQDAWDQLTLLGQMSGIAADMSATANEFHVLTQSLLDSLAQRLLVNAKHELTAKAQMAMDILVRNLFERTADVGFLATDNAVREFLTEHGTRAQSLVGEEDDSTADAAMSRACERLEARFKAYVAKYSVYDDVIVLSPGGDVLVRLDHSRQARRCSHSLLHESVRPGVPFVESFGHFDLLDGQRGLLYSAAIRRSTDGPVLGILCLSFRFDDEMQRIFSNLAPEGGRGAIALTDHAGVVLASSDRWQCPLGACLRLRSGDHRLYFAGREYLAVAAKAHAYQGYAGPMWTAYALLPITQAFDNRQGQRGDVGPEVGATTLPPGAMDQSPLFGEELRRIPRQAFAIQKGLERSVWNGQIHGRKRLDEGSSARFAAVLLQQVTLTGERIRRVFEQAIGELQQSAADSVLHETCFSAALGVDILDRNLYERANDCRWWVLDARLQRALSQSDGRDEAAQVLRHINSLYTVYSRLLLLDTTGRVVASSVDGELASVTADWVQRAVSLRDSQAYARSAFESTALYDGRPSYIYSAAVPAPQRHAGALGAVAIVFDSEPQFQAMLRDALPRGSDGAPMPQALGVFVTRDGCVISSTDARFAVGQRREFNAGLAALDRGESRAMVLEIDGELFATGVAMSRGYREYNSTDAHSADDIACLVMTRLCRRCDIVAQLPPSPAPAVRPPSSDGDASEEIATFRSAAQWLALPVAEVIEAVDEPLLTVLPGSAAAVAGLMTYRGQPLPVLDLARGRERVQAETAGITGTRRPLIICECAQRRFALRVDELGGVSDVSQSALQPLPDCMAQHDPYARALVHTRDDREMVVLLDARKLLARLLSLLPAASATASASAAA